ncbi:ATP-binding protein [Streptomyces sp. NPDC001795]|uniref:ATP-binding protein n=1 Tax=unclassified Streptomyces TaxID=2593676 RepID=UPI00332986BD
MAPPSLPQSLGRLPGGATPHRSDVFELPAVPAAVSVARSTVRGLLRRWDTGGETTENAVLVTSELVTNAVMHAASERIVCRVRTDGLRLHIEVEDENRAETLPVPRQACPDDSGGRGLVLVGVLSSDWGVRDAPHGPGRVVWAELVPEPGEAAATGPPPVPHLRPAPHPAEGPPPHGTTARL